MSKFDRGPHMHEIFLLHFYVVWPGVHSLIHDIHDLLRQASSFVQANIWAKNFKKMK